MSFKVGETVVFIQTTNSLHFPLLNKECEVLQISTMHLLGALKYENVIVYCISLVYNGDNVWCDAGCLRKKPPKEEARSWDEVQELVNCNPTMEHI